MAKITWGDLDPDEVDDRSLDWSKRLPDSDSILTSVWSGDPVGLTLTGQATVGKITRVMISGGSANIKYAILNRITTSEGRTLDQTVYLKVKSR